MASTWIGTFQNETVSRNALDDAVSLGLFRLKNAFTPSVTQVDKTEADVNVYIDTLYPLYANKSSAQLVTRRDFKPTYEYSALMYYFEYLKVTYYGWTSDGEACPNYPAGIPLLIEWNGLLGVGTKIFFGGVAVGLAGQFYNYPYFVIVYNGIPYSVTFAWNGYVDPVEIFGLGYTVATINECISATNVEVANYSSDIVTETTIDGAHIQYVSGANMPIFPSNSGTFTTTSTGGAQTVAVHLSGGSAGQSIAVTDANYTVQCQDIYSNTPTIITFYNVAVNSGGLITISLSAGSCI